MDVMSSYGEWIAVGQSWVKPAQIIQPFEKQSTTELVVQGATRLSQTPLEPPVNLQIHVSGAHMGTCARNPLVLYTAIKVTSVMTVR
jgi:hypothetical protein